MISLSDYIFEKLNKSILNTVDFSGWIRKTIPQVEYDYQETINKVLRYIYADDKTKKEVLSKPVDKLFDGFFMLDVIEDAFKAFKIKDYKVNGNDDSLLFSSLILGKLDLMFDNLGNKGIKDMFNNPEKL